MSVNVAQKEAITHKDGPCMVLAGPGSGKTFTITKRISYLIDSCDVKPEHILVVTFTKAAANEMKLRFQEERNGEKTRVTFGTFHGIFYSILKWAYHLEAENILSEEEKYQILKWAIEKENIDTEDEKELVQNMLGEIGTIKNNRLDIENYRAQFCEDEVFVRIYKRYEKERKAKRKIDFDDMLVMTYELFCQRPELLTPWQEKYQYILVDEFQDVNQVQYDVVRMLAKPENNLFVVGDDDQSIYRFRGSKPEIMLHFPKDFPGAKELVLKENYRSTKAIVRVASRVIAHNKKRFAKGLITNNVQGDTVHIQEVLHPLEESKYVVEEIQKAVKRGVPATEIAVLFRSNVDARIMVETCMEHQIPFHMREQMFNLYEHFIGRDIRAYLAMALGDRSRRKFLLIMNRPNRYLHRDCVQDNQISFEELRKYYEEKDWILDRIDQLEVDFKILRRMAPYAAIQYIRKHIGYDEFLKEYAHSRKIKFEDLQDILYQMEERAKEHKTLESWFAHVEDYTKQLRILESNRNLERNGVSFMTMHSAKGLEFDTVFIIGANEKITPYKKAETVDEIEEERRMFYVAMTRAKRKLIISYTKERNGKPMTRSRFVDEILGE